MRCRSRTRRWISCWMRRKRHGPGRLGLGVRVLEGELAEKSAGLTRVLVEVDGADLVRVEVLSKSPEGGGLAASRLAGEQADSFGVDEIAQARVELSEFRTTKHLVGGEGAQERWMGEAEGLGVEVHSGSP